MATSSYHLVVDKAVVRSGKEREKKREKEWEKEKKPGSDFI